MRFTLLLLALLGLAGCASTTAPHAGRGDPDVDHLNEPRITVLADDLAPRLGFQPARVDSQEGRPMQVEVPCRNLTERNYSIEYRFIFFDAGDVEDQPTMSWTRAELGPKQTARLRGGAMSAEAVDYRLEVQWAR